MRPGQQNRRNRGRNNRKNTNPLSRNYESNGPDVKVRGNAQHVADKYITLARDAQSSGDRVAAENYLQHAEHYNRLIAAAQAQIQQNQAQEAAEQESVQANGVAEADSDNAENQPTPDASSSESDSTKSADSKETERASEPKSKNEDAKPPRARRATRTKRASKPATEETAVKADKETNPSPFGDAEQPAFLNDPAQ